MSTPTPDRSTASLTPHKYDVDLTPFKGHTVLGEPLDLMFSALLRMDFKNQGNGLAAIKGIWPEAEGTALARAMERIHDEAPDDERTEDQRRCDAFVAMLFCVLDAVHAVNPTTA